MELFQPHVVMHGGRKYLWESGDEEGDVTLEVTPGRFRPALTWGLWTIALTGLVGFVEAYASLFFAFEITWSPQDRSEEYLGGGELSMWQDRS